MHEEEAKRKKSKRSSVDWSRSSDLWVTKVRNSHMGPALFRLSYDAVG